MKGTVIALDSHAGRQAAALLRDGQLDDLLIDGPAGIPRPGAVFRAIARRPMKGQGGLFVDLPDGTGFLRQIRGIAPGAALVVQVTGFPSERKAVPVTDRIALKGRGAILTPGAEGRNVSRAIRDPEARTRLTALADAADLPAGTGMILRSQSGAMEDAQIAGELAALAAAWRAIADDPSRSPQLLLDGPGPHDTAWQEWPAPDLLDDRPGSFARHGIDAAIDALRPAGVALPQGATMFIEPTRACIAVDVNTGGDGSPAAGLKANIAAARALPRQLRCRGLGGQITIDFAPAPKKDRQAIENALRSALKSDPVDTTLAGWTPLGHYELQRRRVRLPLHEVPR